MPAWSVPAGAPWFASPRDSVSCIAASLANSRISIIRRVGDRGTATLLSFDTAPCVTYAILRRACLSAPPRVGGERRVEDLSLRSKTEPLVSEADVHRFEASKSPIATWVVWGSLERVSGVIWISPVDELPFTIPPADLAGPDMLRFATDR